MDIIVTTVTKTIQYRLDVYFAMIDFHSHILPNMDDGSRSVSMSLEMLRSEKSQGVNTVILTPHFYSDQNNPEIFLRRREQCWEKLRSELDSGMPELILGAEVQYFEGINRVEEIRSLCIADTDILLLEMPFHKWDTRTVDAVLDLQDSGNVQVVLAHIDRYLGPQSPDAWEEFRRFGISMQVNTEFFEGFFRKRKAVAMLAANEVQFIGTDCHNLSSRKPEWKHVPEKARILAQRNARSFLNAHKLV